MANFVDISAESLAGLLEQFPPRMAVLYKLEFARVRLAPLSRIGYVMVSDEVVVNIELDPECRCRMDGDQADASECELHQSRPARSIGGFEHAECPF